MTAHTSNPYGVGISAEGKHPRVLGYPAYRAWQQMLQRCYGEATQAKQTTYIGVTVCPEWLTYQTFADWYTIQRGCNLGWQLDKDLLASRSGLESKHYSPETCILLPEVLNKTLIVKRHSLSGLPAGVQFTANKEKFVVRCRDELGTQTHVGTFVHVGKAAQAYRIFKQNVLTYLAEKYKEVLDQRAYTALCNYYTI